MKDQRIQGALSEEASSLTAPVKTVSTATGGHKGNIVLYAGVWRRWH